MVDEFVERVALRRDERVLESLEGEVFSAHRRPGCPACDLPGEHVGHECGVTEPGRRANVRDVGHPEPVRTIRPEAPFDEIRALIRLGRWCRGARFTAPDHAFESRDSHESGDLITADLPAGPQHHAPDLPGPVDAVVVGMDLLDHGQ